MNRAQLVEKIQKSIGGDISKAAADRVLTAVIDSIQAGVRKEKSVQLIGFGTFKLVQRKAREGYNPSSKKKIKIKASKTVKFVAGSAFKASL